MNRANRCLARFRSPGLGRNGQPDFAGALGREFVEPQSRKQADDAAWDEPGDFGQRVILTAAVCLDDVESPASPSQFAGLAQAVQDFTRNALGPCQGHQ